MPLLESSFCSTLLQVIKHISHDTQSDYSISDEETAIISHKKGIKSNALSEEVKATVLCNHKDTLNLDLLVITL